MRLIRRYRFVLSEISILVLCLGGAGFLSSCGGKMVCSFPEPEPYPSIYSELTLEGHRVVTVEQIAASLPAEPIEVGFDVDDTVLFSSPGFYYGYTNAEGPAGTNRYGEDFLDSDNVFWTDLNTDLDKFSIPKPSAREVIAMHKARGDTIYFITARPCPSGDPAPLTERLNRVFGLDNEHPVVFTGKDPKATAIRERGIDLFYGDSDGDIEDALAADARAIRFIRSRLSTNPSPTSPGSFGEEVLLHSEN
jgi:acid phosphatase (class B)